MALMQNEPAALCACGCGQPAPIARQNSRAYGYVKGQPVRFIRGHMPTVHGHARLPGPSPTYNTWMAMVARCTRPSNSNYQRYGGRGIAVCERWRTFANFLADMEERPEGKTLERIDKDGNYEPGNCRWATYKEQRANQRPRPRKTHCINGHEFTPENTEITRKGRRCRTCRQLNRDARRESRNARERVVRAQRAAQREANRSLVHNR